MFGIIDNLADIRQILDHSGDMAAGLAANAQVMHIRWPAANVGRCAILDVSILGAVANGTAFAAGRGQWRLSKVTAWSVEGTGGTLISLAGSMGKISAQHPSQSLPTIRIATTAALGSGTQGSIDADFGAHNFNVLPTDTFTPLHGKIALFNAMESGENPIILGPDDGLTVRCTVPATGVWRFSGRVTYGIII